MQIRPSIYTDMIDRRMMQSWEMTFGGQGQVYLSAGCTTAPSGYVFYQINFLATSVLSAAGYYGSYNINTGSYTGASFPANYSWSVPLTSICLTSGSAIGYLYKLQTDCCVVDTGAVSL
jgi:hypothetical protein